MKEYSAACPPLNQLTAGQAVATVRTAWLINGPEAINCLACYASDPRRRVQDELINAWSYFDPVRYARRVLADAPLHQGRLTVDDPVLLPGISCLRNLTDLRVHLPVTADLDCLHGLPALTSIVADRVASDAFPELAHHAGLRDVHIMHLDGPVGSAQPLLVLPALPALRKFAVHGGRFTSDLSFLTRLPQLTTLALPDLDETEDFTPLHSQPGLRDLILYGCGNVTDFEILRPFTALRRLGLFGASLPAGTISEIVNTWPQLRNLELVNADWVTSIAPVTALPLEVLSIKCPQLTDITPIARLPRLRWLYIGGSPFPDLRPVTTLTRLQFLNISRHGYPLTLDLTPIAQLPALRHLSLYDVPGDTDLTPLGKMRNLTISMQEGQHIQGMQNLHHSTRIQWDPAD